MVYNNISHVLVQQSLHDLRILQILFVNCKQICECLNIKMPKSLLGCVNEIFIQFQKCLLLWQIFRQVFDFDSGGKTELDQMGYMLFYKWYFIWYYTRGEIGRVRNTNWVLFNQVHLYMPWNLLTISLLKFFCSYII